MAESENDIPTLTHVAHPGNPDMLNHFDGHQFKDESNEDDRSFALENASELANDFENDIPSISIDNKTTSDISNEDFSEAMQSTANEIPSEKINNNALKQKIDAAIKEAIPGIEAQLKGKLYSKFGI